jgi:arylsulfatase
MPKTSDRPNVLVIFTDQQRGDSIHALGNPVIRTPSFDRLVNEGVAFRRAYSASPVCVSARCSTIYGQYPANTGCYDNSPMPTDGRASYMQALTDAGYRTHGIGKCHFTPDRDGLRGFQTRERQEELVGSPADDDYLPWLKANGYDHLTDPHGVRGEMYYVPQPAQMSAKHHPTQWIGDRSVDFLSNAERTDQPWHLYASFIHPHPPFAPPAPWHKLYRAPLMPLPNVPADHEALQLYINKFQNRYKYRDQGIDQNLMRNMRAHYFACVSFIDYQIGRILAALEESGQLDNTLIIATSDHGEYLGDYECFGKRGMHDSAARVPMIARLPGRFEGGHILDEPASLVDVAPTILGATGASIDDHHLDGLDLADVSSGDTRRRGVVSQFNSGPDAVYMLASKRWKYIYSAPDDKELLFDAVEDPNETRNKANAPFMKDTTAMMRGALIYELARCGEDRAFEKSTDALDGDTWRVYPKKTMSDDPDEGLLVQDPAWAKLDIPGYTDAE